MLSSFDEFDEEDMLLLLEISCENLSEESDELDRIVSFSAFVLNFSNFVLGLISLGDLDMKLSLISLSVAI